MTYTCRHCRKYSLYCTCPNSKPTLLNETKEQPVNKCEFFNAQDFCGFGGVDSADNADRAAHTANRILAERATRVYSDWHSHERGSSRSDMWSTTYWPHDKATDQALLIAIEPIQRDTAESLIRERLEFIESFPKAASPGELVWAERARRVLEGNKK